MNVIYRWLKVVFHFLSSIIAYQSKDINIRWLTMGVSKMYNLLIIFSSHKHSFPAKA